MIAALAIKTVVSSLVSQGALTRPVMVC